MLFQCNVAAIYIMTTYQRVILNGTLLYPTEITVDEIEIEEHERMANGTLRKWHRDYKNTWTLTWEGIRYDYVPTIRALYRTTGVIVYNDETNTSWNVMTMSFNTTLSASKQAANGNYYYDVELVLEEQ